VIIEKSKTKTRRACMGTTGDLIARRKAAVPRGVGMFAGETSVASAAGALLTDTEGKQWIDFSGGIGVVNAGHCPPSVVKAIQEQAAKLLHICIHVATYEPYVALCEKLNSLSTPICDLPPNRLLSRHTNFWSAAPFPLPSAKGTNAPTVLWNLSVCPKKSICSTVDLLNQGVNVQ
jgi:hypothetical protein